MISFRVSPATESTTLSPFHLVFGKEMTLPVDTAFLSKQSMSPDARQYFEELLDRLKIAKEIATANMREAQAKSKEYHDRKAKVPDFAVHDRVLMRVSKVPTGLSPKLFEKYDGPYYISELGPNYTYRLRRCSDHKHLKALINASRLIPYKDPYLMRDLPDPETDADDENYEPQNAQPNRVSSGDTQAESGLTPENTNTHRPLADQKTQQDDINQHSQSDDKYYEVEKLLKVKRLQGKKHYLGKWKGNFKNSWEPEEFITEKPKRDFHIARSRGGKRRRKSRSKFFTY